MTITSQLPKPDKVSRQDKAAATDEAAWQIIDSEASRLAKKTERLRLLREAQEAATPAAAVKAPARKLRAKAS